MTTPFIPALGRHQLARPSTESVLHHLFQEADIITTPHGPVLVLPTRWDLVDDLAALFGSTEDLELTADEEETTDAEPDLCDEDGGDLEPEVDDEPDHDNERDAYMLA